MIIEMIFQIGVNIVNGIIGLFPESNMDFSVNLGEYLQFADQYVNMPLLMTCVGLFLAYEATIILVRAGLFVWNTLKP